MTEPKSKRTEKAKKRATHGKRDEVADLTSNLAIPSHIRAEYPEDQKFRWVNDENGGVQRKISRGWVHVEDETGTNMSINVGKAREDGCTAYLMTVCYEYWKKDFDKQQQLNMAPINALKKEASATGPSDDGSYAPNLQDGGRGFSQKVDSITVSSDG